MTNSSTAQRWQLVQFGREADGLPLERAGHSATVVGNKVYVFGGRKGSLFYNDLLVFNTTTCEWSQGPRCPFKPRANHTSTLVSSNIWFIGGMNSDDLFGDLLYLDLTSNTWHQALVLDPQKLLARCAHAAEVHPRRPATIIVFGGYSYDSQGQRPFDFSSDVLLLHTDRCMVERVQAFKGVPPSPRGYHSMSVVADRAFIYGGRNMEGVIQDSSVLTIYDILNNAWHTPGNVSGAAPLPRSSHRAVAYNGRIIVYGGAVDDRAGVKSRTGDVYSLVMQGSQLCWSDCDSPAPCQEVPPSRSAHTMHLVGGVLYLLLGYAGSSTERKTYVRDCWTLHLIPDAYERWMARATGTRISPAAVLQPAGAAAKAAAAAHGNSNTRAAGDRGRSKSPLGRSGGGAAAVGGLEGAVCGDGAEAGGWRVAKRQRSGSAVAAAVGSGGAAAAAAAAAAGASGPSRAVAVNGRAGSDGCQQMQQQQQPLMPQQPICELLHAGQQQQQQQPYNQSPGMSAAAYAAAAAAAAAAGGAYELRRPASPSYASEYLHELESLRDQLQQQVSRTSRLEGENRQLHNQLGELKADRQAAEAQLQAERGEVAGLRVAKEAAVSEKLRLQEELVHLQQQLEAGRQRFSRLESERDQVLSEKQSCYKEAQRLQGQLGEVERERRAAQEALAAQQEKQRRAEDKAGHERQQQQQALLEMSASLEQTKNELRRLNDAYAEEQRKHDATTNQLRTEAATREAALQEKSRVAADLAQQLEAAKAALLDEQRKAENFRQLHQTTTQQLEALRHTHTVHAAEKARMENELGKLREEHDRVKAELDQKSAAANQARAHAAQVQANLANLVTALG